jgi:hypothetical protein
VIPSWEACLRIGQIVSGGPVSKLCMTIIPDHTRKAFAFFVFWLNTDECNPSSNGKWTTRCTSEIILPFEGIPEIRSISVP